MTLICYSCGKRAQRGNLVSHSKIKTKRKFHANLHARWIKVRGKGVRAKFCTKCLRVINTALKNTSVPTAFS